MKMTPLMPDSDVHRLANTIRQYLSAHPDAADTLEGVVNWWLLRQRYERAVAMVSEALELLVQQGDLTKIKHQGSPTIYKLSERD
ncbi:MAG: hypothetical protein PVG41_00730 [Desulfobacteraceae bacterium]|jgi:hypothetical protein